MKERPILFRDPMVLAILAGRKTQTRPIIEPQPRADQIMCRNWSKVMRQNPNAIYGDGMTWTALTEDGKPHDYRCPYGLPGDLLWVQEEWRVGAWHEESGCIAVDYRADGYCRREWLHVDDEELFIRLWQQSSDDARAALGPSDRYKWAPGQSPCRWRPSIHMPRWASRILLEVISIRVERLQEISEADCAAEGAPFSYSGFSPEDAPDWRGWYRSLWEQINGSGAWDANPWVWVIEFKRVQP